MRQGSEIIKQWSQDSMEDHKKNIKAFVLVFIGWIVGSAILCELTYPLWDKGVLGLIGFMIFCWVAFWMIIKLVEHSKKSKFRMIRDIKKFDERRKEILRQRAVSSLNKA